jgi:hypothetical protein
MSSAHSKPRNPPAQAQAQTSTHRSLCSGKKSQMRTTDSPDGRSVACQPNRSRPCGTHA